MVIHKPVDLPPVVLDQEPDLATLQRLCGGNVQALRMALPPPLDGNPAALVRVTAWFDEEAVLTRKPKNFQAAPYTAAFMVDGYLRGDVVFTGTATPDGTTQGLTANAIAAVLGIFGVAVPVTPVPST